MYTYARGCACIGQNLKETVLGVTSCSLKWENKAAYKLKRSIILRLKYLAPSGVLSSLSCVADGIALRLRGLDSSRSSTPKTKVPSACKSLACEYCSLSSLLFARALAARSVDRRLYSQVRKSRQQRRLAKSNSLS